MKLLDVIFDFIVEQVGDDLSNLEDKLASQDGEEPIKKKRKRIDPNEKKGVEVPQDTKGSFSTNTEPKPTVTNTQKRFIPNYRVKQAVLSDGIPFLCVWDLSSHVHGERMDERNVDKADIDNILLKLEKPFLEYYLVQNTNEDGDFTFENGLDIDQQRFRANQKDNNNFWISGHIHVYARKDAENNSLATFMCYDNEDWYETRTKEYFNKYPEVQELFIVRITSTHKDPPLGALVDKQDYWKKPSHFDVNEEGEPMTDTIKIFQV
jgi:hypothetical protein